MESDRYACIIGSKSMNNYDSHVIYCTIVHGAIEPIDCKCVNSCGKQAPILSIVSKLERKKSYILPDNVPNVVRYSVLRSQCFHDKLLLSKIH